MSARVLKTAVLVGGVYYRAGTTEDAIADGIEIGDGLWVGGDTRVVAADGGAGDGGNAGPGDAPVNAAVREAVEYLVELHLADSGASLDRLLRNTLEVFGEPDSGDGDADGDGESDGTEEPSADDATPAQTVDYSDLTIPQLEAEIDARNSRREADQQIVPGGKGNKPDLVAALEADDRS